MTPVVAYPHVEMVSMAGVGVFVIEGTSVPVSRLYELHVRGKATADTLLKRYPKIWAGAVLSALAFGYDNVEIVEADIQRRAEIGR